MTKAGTFKKVVRRHAEQTGQRYTAALTDLEGLVARMHHEPVAERLLTHLQDRYGIEPVTATRLSVHKTCASGEDPSRRLEAVMYVRPLYLVCFGYRRAVVDGASFDEWGFVEPPGYFGSTAAATRAAFGKRRASR